MSKVNLFWKGVLSDLCVHEVVPVSPPQKESQISHREIHEIAKWFESQEMPPEDTPDPEYYDELKQYLRLADQVMTSQMGGGYLRFYDERQWKHPWLGQKIGTERMSYHMILLNMHDWLTRQVLKKNWNNPRNHDNTYLYMLELLPVEAHAALFMELRARICYGLVTSPDQNSLVSGQYRFIPNLTQIPVQFLCRHQNYPTRM